MSMDSIDEYAECAHDLVNKIIENSLQYVQQEIDANVALNKDADKEALLQMEGSAIKCSIQDFTIDEAEIKIQQFIQTWRYHECWLYCIDYLGSEEFDYDVRFRFRVKWSIPTRRRPIPRATASVYFTFSVSKIKLRSYPVEVYYVFETQRLVHRPGDSLFREQWLKDIIENKVIMQESICF